LAAKAGFDMMPFSLCFVFCFVDEFGYVGIVTGFMMLDERDGNIATTTGNNTTGQKWLFDKQTFVCFLFINHLRIWSVLLFLSCSICHSFPLFFCCIIGILYCNNRFTDIFRSGR
jgi:hypothetical protein